MNHVVKHLVSHLTTLLHIEGQDERCLLITLTMLNGLYIHIQYCMYNIAIITPYVCVCPIVTMWYCMPGKNLIIISEESNGI